MITLNNFPDIIKTVDKLNSCINDRKYYVYATDLPTVSGTYMLYLLDSHQDSSEHLVGSITTSGDIFRIQLKHNYNSKVKLRDVLKCEMDCFENLINLLNENISLINNNDLGKISLMDTFNETNVLSSFQDFKLIYNTNICFNPKEALPYICHSISLYSLKKNIDLFSVDIGEIVRHSNVDFSFNIINNFFKNYYFQPYVNKCACEMTPDEKMIIKMLYI